MPDTEDLSNDGTKSLLDSFLGGGAAGTAVPSVSTNEFEKEGIRLEKVVEEEEAKEKKNFADPELVEPSVEPVPVTPVGMILSDTANAASDLSEGDFTAAAIGAFSAIPGIPDAAVEALEATFVPLLFARQAGLVSDDTFNKAQKLVEDGDFEGLKNLDTRLSVGAVDNIARFEIPDGGFQRKKAASGIRPGGIAPISFAKPIGDLYDHPELFEAFPRLAEVKIRMQKPGKKGSSYNPKTDTIFVADGRGPDSILHELQHAIQTLSGLPRGTNPKAFEKMGFNDADSFMFYLRSIGETEARDVAKRFKDKIPPGVRPTAIEALISGKGIEAAPFTTDFKDAPNRRFDPKDLSEETFLEDVEPAGSLLGIDTDVNEVIETLKVNFPDATISEINEFLKERGG